MFTSQELSIREAYLLCPDTCNILTYASYLVKYVVGETCMLLRSCNCTNLTLCSSSCCFEYNQVLCKAPFATRGL